MENTNIEPHIEYPKVTINDQQIELKFYSEDIVWLRTQYGVELNDVPDKAKLSANLEHTSRLLAAAIRHAVEISAEQILKLYTPRELVKFSDPLGEAIKQSFPEKTPAETPSPSQLVQ